MVAVTYVAGPNTRLIEEAIFGILQAPGSLAFALGHTIEEQAQAQLSAAGT